MPGGPRRLALLPLLHALVGGEGAGPPGRGGSPSGVFSVADYGGRPGPGGNNTAAFGRAIAACSAAGGGVVDVPPGVWVSGGIRLGSHMVLRLRAGATIRGITPASPHDILTDYPLYNGSCAGVVGPQPLVLADGAVNVSIEGPGTLDGNGEPFWVWANLWPGYDYNNASDPSTPMAGRPSVLRMINCTDVVWRDVEVRRSPFWATQIIASRRVLVERVRILVNDSNYCPDDDHCYQPTNEDGIDIAASQHVVVRDSTIYAHDDSIALLAGQGWWPASEGGVERTELFNVTVHNCTMTSEQSAIALDTAWGCGDCRIHDVTVTNCRVGLPGFGPVPPAPVAHPPPCQLRKLPWDSPFGCEWPMTGQVVHARGGPGSSGVVENILVQDIDVGSVMQVVFLAMCLGYDPTSPCPGSTAHLPPAEKLPSFRSMTFRRISARYASERFLNFFGIPDRAQIEDIVLEDVSVGAFGASEGGPAVECSGASGVSARGVTVGGAAVDSLCAEAAQATSRAALADASQVVPYRYTVTHGNISAAKPTKLTTVCNFSSPNASLHNNCVEDKTAHLTFIDCENFTVVSGDAEARDWAHSANYFAMTVADANINRRAYLYLGGPNASTGENVAGATLHVADDGDYHVLVRYEMPYRFEVPFKVTVEQGGKKLLEYVMGRRTNLKLWPFSSGGYASGWTGSCGAVESSWSNNLVTECHWPYGATENVLWEGYNTTQPVALKAGTATVTLETVRDCDDCNYGNRNIDVVLLHPLTSDIEMRVHTPPEDSLLPLDGLFSQYGEIFFKVQNFNSSSLLLEVPITYNHATYFAQHLHNVGDPYTAPYNTLSINVSAGETTPWIETGWMADSLNRKHSRPLRPCQPWRV